MKNLKTLALLVLTVAVLLMSFTSCDQLSSIPGFENILELLPGLDNHTHVFTEATCTTPATCECGETEGDALGHTFLEGVCSVCGETDPNYVPPHEHSFVDGKCECGETDPNYVPPHEHSFVDGKCECGETDPNYVPPHEHSFVEGKCECGETDPNYVPPHEHSFVDGKCECGETDPNYVPPHEHNFVDGKCECGEYDHEHEFEENVFFHPELEAATCTAPGVAVFECTICDYYYTEATPINPEAHGFWGDREVLVVANCQTQTNGLEKVYCANGCGSFEEVEIFYSEVHEWDVQTEIYPTCTTDGSYYAVCTLCGEIDSRDIPAGGHYNWYLTCGDTGECMECGEQFTIEHDLSFSPATCTEAAFCMNCAQYVGEPIPHTYVDGVCECGAEYVAPTLGDWTLTTELKNGDLVIIGAPAYGKLLSTVKVSTHYNKGIDYSADNFANVTDAEIFVVTVNADGTYTFTSLTGDVLALADSYASLNKDGAHKTWTLTDRGDGTFLIKNVGRGNYLEWYNSKGNWSTYTAGNTAEYYLSFYTRKPNEELHAHNYISESHDPTCTEAGYTSYTCACGDSYTVAGEPATGHSYTPEVTNPTCTEAGYTTHTCSCGDSYTTDEVAALGHTFVEGKCECGETDASYVPPFGGGSADFNTITTTNANGGDSSYTKTFTTANGWVTNNSAIQVGGATVMNPQYPVIGADNSYKAVCLNGKTSAPGQITSPTLNDGLSKLTINFTKIFTDTELSVTVTVTELSTGNVYTYVVARSLDKNEKYVIHTEEWVLETPVTGDFTITIVNNCPTNQDSNKDRMTILSIVWEGAAPAHEHEYTMTTTATCTEAGVNTYTCACGDTYTEETEKLGHVDADLDVECDREGCTSKVAPAADSLLSNFTANNLGSKLSVSSSYYVEGVIVEVLDAKNGIFLIDDGTGETFYFRLPKNAEGVSHANWEVKLVLGDKVSVYGKINKYTTTTAPNGQFWPAIQGGVVTLLEQHPHDFTFQPASCDQPAFCSCGQSFGEALGCMDADGDDFCDNCSKNLKYVYEYVEIRTDNNSGVRDEAAGTYTWGNDNFDVQVAKGTSTQLYSTAKDHMRVYKGNQLLFINKNGLAVSTITVYLTNATQVTNFEKFLTGYTYTTDAENFSVTVEINSAESFTLTNTASTTQIKGIEVAYEKAEA